MQEEVENRTVNLAVTTTKLTARSVLAACMKYLRHRGLVKEKKAAEKKAAKRRAEKKEAEERLAEKRAKKAAESAGKFELTFTGSSVESITQIMTERMMSGNTSTAMISGFDMKA